VTRDLLLEKQATIKEEQKEKLYKMCEKAFDVMKKLLT